MTSSMLWQITSASSADTEKLGQLLASNLKPGKVVELIADLGGGKTTFTRGMMHGFGSKDLVSSPTFTLKNIYEFPGGQIHHFDFYRLDEPGIMAEQLSESLSDPQVITIVEWGDVVKNILPANRLTIKFELAASSPDERLITFSYDESDANVIKKIESQWQGSKP